MANDESKREFQSSENSLISELVEILLSENVNEREETRGEQDASSDVKMEMRVTLETYYKIL